MNGPPLIVHVIHRLAIGGLENGVVNLLNRIPAEHSRHAVVCLQDATDFRLRLREDVAVHELHRRPGQDPGMFLRLYGLLKTLRPAIVHTRNLSAVECQIPAWAAGVPARIHGEHGWDVFDPDGSNRKYQYLRRAVKPFIHRYIPLSVESETYLVEKIRVPRARITRICNGVDTSVFRPGATGRSILPDCPFGDTAGLTLVGTAGRMHGVKDQLNLVRAFVAALESWPELSRRARLVLIGDGPLRSEAESLLEAAGVAHLAWLTGERSDVPELLRGLDIFVLPSRAEGISNTILEAMATGLPVIATAVGGNPELVVDGVTGRLVPKENATALAAAILDYFFEPGRIAAHGRAGLARIQEAFSLDGMVRRYVTVYDEFLPKRPNSAG